MSQSDMHETPKSIKRVKLLLDILWYAGLVVLLLMSIDIINAAGNWGETTEFNFEMPGHIRYGADTKAIEIESLLCDDIRVAGYNSIRLASAKPDWKVFTHGVDMIIPLFFLIIIFQLRRFFKTTLAGEPFALENVRRIRKIGLLVLIFGPFYGTLCMFVTTAHLNTLKCLLPDASIGYELTWHPKFIVLGFLIIILSEIFKIGARLQRDADLTI